MDHDQPDPSDNSDNSDHPDRPEPDVGSLADEATRLLGALGGWAREHGVTDPDPASTDPAGGPHGHDGLTGDCTWCPVCRTAQAVRRTSPEVRDQLLVAATALMQAGSGLLAALQSSAEERGAPRPRPDGPPAGRVERIDLDEGPDDGPDDTPDDERQGEV
jgi:hypothetical protein